MLKKKQFGGVKDKKDSRDLYYEMIGGGEWEDLIAKLPESFKVDYDEHWFYNQGSTSSCGSHASCGILNYKLKAKTSPRYLWRFVKTISNLPWGSYTRDNVDGLVKFGSCAYDKAPNEKTNTKSDEAYLDLKVTPEMQVEASKHRCEGYVRANSLMGNSFDTIRKFIYETKSPVIMSLPYYQSYNKTSNGGEWIKKEGEEKSVGHIVLVIGWDKDRYVIVDSYDRIVYLNRGAETWDAWGIIDFQKAQIDKPKKPEVRDLAQERKNASALQTMIYKEFASSDKARVTAFKHWFKMINALTYKGYTFRDIINWVYFIDRKGKELFDITLERSTQIKE